MSRAVADTSDLWRRVINRLEWVAWVPSTTTLHPDGGWVIVLSQRGGLFVGIPIIECLPGGKAVVLKKRTFVGARVIERWDDVGSVKAKAIVDAATRLAGREGHRYGRR
ncbi:MAG: hypothetical protein AAGI53_10645 [Planctomycetota bacterium]